MKWFITGGAGFVGINCAKRLLDEGEIVIIFDNFSRIGTEENASLIKGYRQCTIIKGDARRNKEIEAAIRENQPDVVLHLAAQVAVTTSIENPREDFECNALGTFNVLEAVRQYFPEAIILNASTNKVYGRMDDVSIIEKEKYYDYQELTEGNPESRPLDFHSPYGCSKGAAEQYVIDYSRIYGLRTVNFRQSCIYGRNQFGIEDQGWVAWFIIASILGKSITIYGDGKQVRDLLHINDLIELYQKAVKKIERISGETFNIGGGPKNKLSLLQLLDVLEGRLNHPVEYCFAEWRSGDQKVYISDIRKIKQFLHWTPRISPEEGVNDLINWVIENREMIARSLNHRN